MDYDLKIHGGTIIDGTGADGVRGDVGITDGRVVALGDAPGTATRTLDADGHVVAPGFVDIHTHYDVQVMWDRGLSISPWHGVTSVVVGNCGFGVAPTKPDHRDLILRTLEKVEGMSLDVLHAGLGAEWPFETFPEYLNVVENLGTAINMGVLVGHTPVRMYVMGEASTERAAAADEIAQMRALVSEALRVGAVGFATSKSPTHIGYEGRPVPSRAAEFDEIRALAGALKDAGAGVMQATIGPELFYSEFAEIATDTGRPISWTALLGGLTGPGSHRTHMERSAQLAADGLPIYPQVSCRPLNFDFNFIEPFPFESLRIFKPVSAAADVDGKARVYGDPDFRAAFKEKSALGRRGPLSGWWQRATISHSPMEPALEGRALTDIADERGVDPVDLALDLALASEMQLRISFAVLNYVEDEVAELLQDPHVVLGLSDAGAHASQLCDACFSTYLLGHWVREKETLSLPQAIRMLTSRPAEVFGLSDRGLLAQGRPADVVVFDPSTVGAGPIHRVYDLPGGADRLISDAAGIRAVVVNGTVIREDGADRLEANGAMPGRLLRHGRADG